MLIARFLPIICEIIQVYLMSNIEEIIENYKNSTEKCFAQISEGGHIRSKWQKIFLCESYNFQFKQIARQLFISLETQC